MKRKIENLAAIGFIALSVLFCISVLILSVQLLSMLFVISFWAALAIVLLCLMVGCIAIIRYMPQEK